MNVLFLPFAGQCDHFVLIRIEYVLLTAPKVRMYLAWQKSVLGNIGLP